MNDRAFQWARRIVEAGGEGLAIRERPFHQGIELTVWCPDSAAAEIRDDAVRAGWDVTLFCRQPVSLSSARYDGWQIKVTIGWAESRRLVAGLRSLTPGMRALPGLSDAG